MKRFYISIFRFNICKKGLSVVEKPRITTYKSITKVTPKILKKIRFRGELADKGNLSSALQYIKARRSKEIAHPRYCTHHRPQPTGTQMELDLVVWINEIKTTVEGHQTYLMGQPLEQFDGTASGLDAQQFVHNGRRFTRLTQYEGIERT